MICGREEIRGFSEVAGVMSLGDFLEEPSNTRRCEGSDCLLAAAGGRG